MVERPWEPSTRSLRAPGWFDEPDALRSLDVCLDSKGPFIDAIGFRQDHPSERIVPFVTTHRGQRPRGCRETPFVAWRFVAGEIIRVSDNPAATRGQACGRYVDRRIPCDATRRLLQLALPDLPTASAVASRVLPMRVVS